MDTYFRFLFEFLSVFFNGIGMMINGIVKGVIQIFNIKEYRYIIEFYRSDLTGGEMIMVVVAIAILVLLVGLVGLLIFFVIRKYIRFSRTLVEQESLLEEVGNNDLRKQKEFFPIISPYSQLRVEVPTLHLNG